MKGTKNDYSMTFYHEKERIMFLEYVHSTESAIAWMRDKNKAWTHANIYDRRTRAFISRVYFEK